MPLATRGRLKGRSIGKLHESIFVKLLFNESASRDKSSSNCCLQLCTSSSSNSEWSPSSCVPRGTLQQVASRAQLEAKTQCGDAMIRQDPRSRSSTFIFTYRYRYRYTWRYSYSCRYIYKIRMRIHVERGQSNSFIFVFT